MILNLSTNPSVEVGGSKHQWRSALTLRHAEILALLHRPGPTGLSAAELSRSIYGDGDHIVAVRAEVSRLRRKLGAVVVSLTSYLLQPLISPSPSLFPEPTARLVRHT